MLVGARKSNNEHGFTLIEMLLVLSIVTILTAIILPIGERWARTTAEEDAITSLVATVYSLQSFAMANQTSSRISFSREGSRTAYMASAAGHGVLSRKYLPEGMSIGDSSSLKEIQFQADGDVFDFGTLFVVGASGHTKIAFQFQRGRMIISESKGIFLAGSSPDPRSPYGHLWYAPPIRNEDDFQA